ncbi:plasmid mobilization protein [Elstera cyanobacteriorum]|uniref:plasmid mobilization protein n=1 Tax=Elstera cyanobacteriorum TaxID=2022747 RepID=UPI00235621FA|nr:plasmid mobilization relaxosome protein MobC [Elstera cyanobacteriorum]MCK6442547.1 MobC family plasmid mobilization relaxosome protein [Elstera cyanobacteriorum]
MSESRQKTKVLGVRLTPEEHCEIARLADMAGLSSGELCRRSLLNRKIDFQARLTAETLRELSRIGNNLNQVSRHLNGGGHLIYGEVSDTLLAIQKAAKSLIEKGGSR